MMMTMQIAAMNRGPTNAIDPVIVIEGPIGIASEDTNIGLPEPATSTDCLDMAGTMIPNIGNESHSMMIHLV